MGLQSRQRQWLVLGRVLACLLGWLGTVAADVSRPGGAGHALLFRDHGVKIENFKDLSPDALTFEAWLSTSDSCHSSALMSYALDSTATDPHSRTADFNAFVVFDPSQTVACRGFEYIDLWPDPGRVSCYSAFNHSSSLPNFVERDGRWHHLAVTWTAANGGFTQIYWDGLLMASAVTGKTTPLPPGGALMLGAEQDCYGGCTDRGQGYYGLMDEVRLWRTARSQADILAHMRDSTGLENHPDLAAYWKFNDPELNGMYRQTLVAKDSSGRGNDIHLVTLPTPSRQTIQKGGKRLDTGALSFRNNYAMNNAFTGMPDRDITIEFWARTPAITPANASLDTNTEFFSFAAFMGEGQGSTAGAALLDDALLIERYSKEFGGTHHLDYDKSFSTAGSLSVHVNANRAGMGKKHDNWVDFATKWVDNEWHHVAVTWSWGSGQVQLYLDGKPQTPFWSSTAGRVQYKNPDKGGVDPHIAARSARSPNGSLALGQMQDCYGGCFSPQYALRGDMANLRVWKRVLPQSDIEAGMFSSDPPNKDGLVASYAFDPDKVKHWPDGTGEVQDVYGRDVNPLILGADAPAWVYSTAPLAIPDGKPVGPPTAGSAGHAMYLSDQQVLILKGFKDFPAEELTLEFWMMSTDTCRPGVPFSYATGGYSKSDNSFLLFNYNSWGVSVMEDEGGWSDHLSGVAATDGRWHHVAVTWRSYDGLTRLYDNGREVWSVIRGKGAKIPSGGTLVVGREQDCEGGCFDSAAGAAGDTDEEGKMEYGAQDFFGVIDEMRVWRKARTEQQIRDGMQAQLFRKGMTGQRFDKPGVDPKDPDLVAYWNFDEGQGWTVHDITGRGHHLVAAENPRWEVVRWLSVCGNGLLEGMEECDDGDEADGDGCNSACKIEDGWECSKTSPSVCTYTGARRPPPTPSDPHSRGGGGGGSSSGGSPSPPSPPPSQQQRHRHSGWAITAIVLIAVGAAAGLAYAARERINDHFPQVESAVDSVMARLTGRRSEYTFAGELPYVGAADGLSSDFTQARPAPGRGPYETLPAMAQPPAPPQP